MTEVKETSLLMEGMRSYPKALAALNEFARLVISTIRDVTLEELAGLSAAMCLDLSQDELGDYVSPNRLAISSPKDAILGVRIDRIVKSGWGLYSYLWWSKGETKLCVSIWLRDATLAESVFAAFKKLPPATSVDLDSGHEVYVSRALAPADADEIPIILRELTQKFSSLWTNAGGLEKFLKA